MLSPSTCCSQPGRYTPSPHRRRRGQKARFPLPAPLGTRSAATILYHLSTITPIHLSLSFSLISLPVAYATSMSNSNPRVILHQNKRRAEDGRKRNRYIDDEAEEASCDESEATTVEEDDIAPHLGLVQRLLLSLTTRSTIFFIVSEQTNTVSERKRKIEDLRHCTAILSACNFRHWPKGISTSEADHIRGGSGVRITLPSSVKRVMSYFPRSTALTFTF